jgi:CheY-like chemotaxis protein
VQDTGVGIPADKLEAIFKPFVQAGEHREKERQGTGLGLSIVRRLTEMMGGTVTAASVPGQGSAFSLRFKDVAVSARLPVNEKLEPGRAVSFDALQPATLLVVDDNEINCQLVAGMFAGTAHRLVFGANGFDAVTKAREIKPDLILLDIRMPGLDGRQALVEIRKSPGLEMTPVIAVTASSLMEEEKDLKQQFSGYVRKPFTKQELFNELAQFLARKKPDATTPAFAVAATSATAPELVKELRRLEKETWPAVCDALAVNETKAFAAALEKLAVKWPCTPLQTYAQTLASHAESYAVVEMEKQLQHFPALIDQLTPPPVA